MSPDAAWTSNDSGETPVMAALYRGHHDLAGEIADAIVGAGKALDVFAAAALGRGAALDAALGNPGVVNSYAYDGWTPLHLAAFFGRREAAERLLAAGAALSAKSTNSMSNTPLHAAVAGGRTDVALLLIQRGAEVNAADSAATRRCTSPPRTGTRRWSSRCSRTAPTRTPWMPRTRRPVPAPPPGTIRRSST